MSDQELKDLKQLILDVEKNLSCQIISLKREVEKSHEPRIRELEQSVPAADDIARIKEIIESFGNWRFLFKFFAVVGGVISFFIWAIYLVVKIVKML